MFTSSLRFGLPAIIAVISLSMAPAAQAQEKTPFPPLSGRRVYVVGVPDRYEGLADQISRLERSSPQSYYVVVVKSTGRDRSATSQYADDLFDAWRAQAAKGGQ